MPKKPQPPDSDFIYENPPLIEAVFEFRWKLKPLKGIPNAALDLYFDEFVETFTKNCARKGYGHVETLALDDAPIPLHPHKVTKRFHMTPNEWPAFQIGPGVVTVNIIPPYQGWKAFRPAISEVIKLLMKSYPNAKDELSPLSVELRYIDAFTEESCTKPSGQILRDELGLLPELPPGFLKHAEKDENNIRANGRLRIELANPQNSIGTMDFGTGINQDKKDAAVVQSIVSRKFSRGDKFDQEVLTEWSDAAHSVVKNWFELITSENIKERMGRKIEV